MKLFIAPNSAVTFDSLWATPKSNITQLKIKQLGFFIPLKIPFRVNRVSTDSNLAQNLIPLIDQTDAITQLSDFERTMLAKPYHLVL